MMPRVRKIVKPRVRAVLVLFLIALPALGCGGPNIEALRENQDYERLIRILEDEDREVSVRAEAAEALGDAGGRAPAQALIRTYNESRTLYEGRRLRRACLDALVRIDSREAAAGLLEVVWGVPFGDRDHAEQAAEAAVEIGDETVREIEETYLPRLPEASEGRLRRTVGLLGDIGGEDAFRILAQLAGRLDRTSGCSVCDGTVPSFDAFHQKMMLSMVEEDEDALAYLQRMAESEDPLVRQGAVYALGAFEGEQAVDTLVEAVKEEAGETRMIAFVNLAEIDPQRAGALMAESIRSTDPGEFGLELYMIRDAELPPNAIEDEDYETIAGYLIDVLGRGGAGASSQALYTLRRFADERAVEGLLELLQQADARRDAAYLLGRIGDARAVAPLVGAFEAEPAEVVYEALARIGDGAALLPYLEREETVWVYHALIRIGEPQTEDALIEALSDFGDKRMAVAYLNCGNSALEEAARAWAAEHGYVVSSLPRIGSSDASEWGEP